MNTAITGILTITPRITGLGAATFRCETDDVSIGAKRLNREQIHRNTRETVLNASADTHVDLHSLASSYAFTNALVEHHKLNRAATDPEKSDGSDG